MRLFALSDLHVDYEANFKWVRNLSRIDYRDDVLMVAGDVTHHQSQLAACLDTLVARCRNVLFVPGNHDLWVWGEEREQTSLHKFARVVATVEASGAVMRPSWYGQTLIVPLLGWYDYSFGAPSEELRQMWMDYRACRWPEEFEVEDVAAHFAGLNRELAPAAASRVITFSHFLPRVDLVPAFVPARHRVLDPVLGSTRLERQLRQLGSTLHVYGHSHINRRVRLDGVTYVNNAFGYPSESGMTARELLRVAEI